MTETTVEGKSPSLRLKSVSRINFPQNRTVGWVVRVCVKDSIISKFFADRKHGGTDEALQKAIAFRDETEKTHDKPPTERYVRFKSHANNAGGIPGVVEKVVGGRHIYEVTWCPQPGVVKRTSVSILKYGKERALKLAMSIRSQRLRTKVYL